MNFLADMGVSMTTRFITTFGGMAQQAERR